MPKRGSASATSMSRQVSTAQLRAAVLPALEKSPPRFDCRILALSQVGTRPPTFRLRVSRPDAVTPVYERFVVSELRGRFKFPGYPVRIRVTR